MARSRRRRPGKWRWALRGMAFAALVFAGFAGWLWWDMQSWRPARSDYPEQGALIASGAAAVRFESLRATGARFAYIALADASGAPDPGFGDRLEAARATNLKVGVVQPFDPCLPADPQSARFARMVPRDADMLPPAIALSRTGERCSPAVSDAAVESELTTFINQIERHAGQPVILKLAPGFAARHSAAANMARELWLERERVAPSYAGRPWLLWSANSALVNEASEEPVEWVVVQN